MQINMHMHEKMMRVAIEQTDRDAAANSTWIVRFNFYMKEIRNNVGDVLSGSLFCERDDATRLQ